MKKIILILTLSILLVGCNKNNEMYSDYREKNNFTVIKEFEYGVTDDIQIYVIKDNETDYEYIVCKNNFKGGITITPRLKNPVILKEENFNE